MDPQLDEPDLRSYLGVIARRKWWVVSVTALFLGVAIGMSVLVEPLYQVEAQVQTTSTTSAASWVLSQGRFVPDADREAEIQVAFLESTDLRFNVLDACDESMPCAQVWNVDAEPLAESEDPNSVPSVVQLTLLSSQPEGAANLLNVYAETYVEELQANEQESIIDLMGMLQAEISQLDQEIQSLDGQPDQQATVNSLRQTKANHEAQLYQLRFTSGLANGGGAMVLGSAAVPDTPVSPNLPRNLAIGLAFGLFLGVAIAFVRDYFDDSVKSKDAVERLTGVPVLGLIPRFDKSDSELVAATASSSPAAEAFRSLRTSVKFLAVDRDVRVVQVTSPSPGEGKTVVATNLATVFAQAGDRVVLVGGDLRRPRAEELLGVALTPGLTGVLIGEVALPQAIRGVEGLPNLSVLPAGYPPPNPSELLSGERARRLVDVLAQTYDLVVIDSPPVLPVSDALVLARMADTTLLVTSANRTSRRDLDRAVEVLHQVNAPLFGAVMSSLSPGATYTSTYGNETYRYDLGGAAGGGGSRGKGARRSGRAVPVGAAATPGSQAHAAGEGNGAGESHGSWPPADSGIAADSSWASTDTGAGTVDGPWAPADTATPEDGTGPVGSGWPPEMPNR